MSDHPGPQMPEHERAPLALLDLPPGTVGPFLDESGDVLVVGNLAEWEAR